MAPKTDGLVSVIKYEGSNDVLVWKYPEEDFKYGTQLIVHESQEAIFFRDGQALDLFGPAVFVKIVVSNLKIFFLRFQVMPLCPKMVQTASWSQATLTCLERSAN